MLYHVSTSESTATDFTRLGMPAVRRKRLSVSSLRDEKLLTVISKKNRRINGKMHQGVGNSMQLVFNSPFRSQARNMWRQSGMNVMRECKQSLIKFVSCHCVFGLMTEYACYAIWIARVLYNLNYIYLGIVEGWGIFESLACTAQA